MILSLEDREVQMISARLARLERTRGQEMCGVCRQRMTWSFVCGQTHYRIIYAVDEECLVVDEQGERSAPRCLSPAVDRHDNAVGQGNRLIRVIPDGAAPPPKRRLPSPTTTGNVHRRNSLIRSYLSKAGSARDFRGLAGRAILFFQFFDLRCCVARQACGVLPRHWVCR